MRYNKKDIIRPTGMSYRQFKNIVKTIRVLTCKYYDYIQLSNMSFNIESEKIGYFHKKLLEILQITETEFISRKQQVMKGKVYILKNKTFISTLMYLFKEDFQINKHIVPQKIYNYESLCQQIEKLTFEILL